MTARRIGGVALISLLVAACADGPTGPGGGAGDGDVLACQVTDESGVEDGGFNELAFRGMQRARGELGVGVDVLESAAPADYGPNIAALIERGCDVIVAASIPLAEALVTAAEENPEARFVAVGFTPDPAPANLAGVTFRVGEAAFLAGYAAAATSESGTVGTFGSLNVAPVTDMMDGFAAGVAFFDRSEGRSTRLRGWDPAAGEGAFAEDFSAAEGLRLGADLLDAGADVIFPATQPGQDLALGAAAGARAVGVRVIWPNVDGCSGAPEYCEVILTSVLARVDLGVLAMLRDVVGGGFRDAGYVGTLANGGVDISPVLPAPGVPADLADRLEEIRADIESGALPTEPGEEPVA